MPNVTAEKIRIAGIRYTSQTIRVAVIRLAIAAIHAGFRLIANRNKSMNIGSEATKADPPMLCATGV
jgi:hypothetical protein